MKKKKIFTNKIEGKIGNNQASCEVGEREIKKETVEEKLDHLFNSNGYIFNIKVKIETIDKIYNTKIASRVGNSLITLDNDVINIDDIKNIDY